jgi:hypothetical protein
MPTTHAYHPVHMPKERKLSPSAAHIARALSSLGDAYFHSLTVKPATCHRNGLFLVKPKKEGLFLCLDQSTVHTTNSEPHRYH